VSIRLATMSFFWNPLSWRVYQKRQTGQVRPGMLQTHLERIIKCLVDYGLTEIEARIFVYLARFGPCKAKSVTEALSIPRAKTYKVLKEMQAKGIVEASLEYPMRFSACRLEEVLDSALQNQMRRITTLEEEKMLLLASWRSLDIRGPTSYEEKFQIIRGIDQIYTRAARILEDPVNQVSLICLGKDLLNAYRTDFLEQLQRFAKEQKVRFLTKITMENARIFKGQSTMEVRHIRGLSSSFPNFIMADGRELIIFIKSSERGRSTETTALWTNSQALTRLMSVLFERIWTEAVPVSDAIDSITSRARPSEEVEVMEEARRLNIGIENAKQELVSTLRKYGFTALENYRVKGKSGVSHVFDLKIQFDDRSILIDFAFSSSPVSMRPIIVSFVKKLDCEEAGYDHVLIVKPSLSVEARKLAELYQIRFKEL